MSSCGLPTPGEFASKRRAANAHEYNPYQTASQAGEPSVCAPSSRTHTHSQHAPAQPVYASSHGSYTSSSRYAAPEPEFRRSRAPSPTSDRDYFNRARQPPRSADPDYSRAETYAQAERIETARRQQAAMARGGYGGRAYIDDSINRDNELLYMRREQGRGYGESHRSSEHRVARQESVANRWEQESYQRTQSFARASEQTHPGQSRLAADLAAARARR